MNPSSQKGRKFFPICVALSLLAHAAFFLSFFILGDRLSADRLLGLGRHVGVLFVDLGEIGGGEGGGETPSLQKASPPPETPKKNPAMTTREKAVKEKKTVSDAALPPAPSPTVSTGAENMGGEAAGTGGGALATPGTGGTGPGGPSGGGSGVLAEIRKKIERAKRYPTLARQQEIEGSVRLSFSIEPTGEVTGLTLLGSSGSSILDQEALATVKRAAPLPYYPNPIRISLKFSLEDE